MRFHQGWPYPATGYELAVSIRVMEQILESVTPSENSMSPTSVFEEKDVKAAVVNRSCATNGASSAAR
jgi:hypothetical protein